MEPITVTALFNAPLEKVWHALSDETELRKWYFPVENYTFEEGHEFSFYESTESKKYLHRCKFLNIKPKKLIEYTWEHPEQSQGTSVVKWDLRDENGQTRLTLTHTGTETFGDAGAAFSPENYTAGWNAIVKTMLRNHLYGIDKIRAEVEIYADAAKVWNTLWDKETYPAWTAPFCDGSYMTGELTKGSRVHFMTPSGEGMYSDVEYVKEHELMVFKHIGVVVNNAEQPIDPETEKWTGSYEIYTLTENNGKTRVVVDVDTVEKYADYMKTTFPVALQELKQLAENH